MAISMALESPVARSSLPAVLAALSIAGAQAAEPADDASFLSRLPDIQLEANVLHDTNVTRGRVDTEKLRDTVYSLQGNADHAFTVGSNSRVTLTGRLGGEAFTRYTSLGRVFGDVQARFEYRASAEFDAATFGAFVDVAGDHYGSRLRRGHRYTVGATVQKPLTDRISVVALVAHDERRAKSAVFEGRTSLARLSADYSLRQWGTLYFTGDFRYGDTVSTGIASLENIDTAKVLVQDNAFRRDDLFSYRFDAKTYVTTLGYNYGFNAKSSVDIFWRHIISKPQQSVPFATSVPDRYVSNQFSISYLVRF